MANGGGLSHADLNHRQMVTIFGADSMPGAGTAEEDVWSRCVRSRCRGVRIEGAEECLAHAEPATVTSFVEALEAGGQLDIRGTRIGGDLFTRLRAACVVPLQQCLATGAIFLDDVDFSRFRFEGGANFDKAVFRGSARFDNAFFEGTTYFTRARFDKRAVFDRTLFTAEAWFTGTRFGGSASFDQAEFRRTLWFERVRVSGNLSMTGTRFRYLSWFNATVIDGSSKFEKSSIEGDSSFEECVFKRRVTFSGAGFGGLTLFTEAQFGEEASFEGCSFARDAKFGRASFDGEANLDRAAFSGSIWLEGVKCAARTTFERASFGGECHADGAVFAGGLWLTGAEFSASTRFGLVDAGPTLVLNQATFQHRVRLQVSADRLVSVAARFLDGAVIHADRADMAFDGSVFAEPSTLAATSATSDSTCRPRVVSLRRVDLTNVSVVDLDTSACLFADAYHLDNLRIEDSQAFSLSPAAPSLSFGAKAVPLLPFWTRRRVIAEERHWRAAMTRGPKFLRRRWITEATQPPEWLGDLTDHEPEQLSADRISNAYRALRKSYEDAKNEPGAADFYYGEMEMRRKAAATPRADRFILGCYWAISGYGLRAWRAIMALLLVVAGHGVLFTYHGFAPRPGAAAPGHLQGQLFALDSLLFNPDRNVPLTTTGAVLRLTIKILGPLLLGLAVLAVRNRVKR